MPIENDLLLREVAEKVSALVQEIQSYLGERKAEEGEISFPYGLIRTARRLTGPGSLINGQA